MKVVVTGGRDYQLRDQVFRVLNLLNGAGRYNQIDVLAHGACGWDADDGPVQWDALRGADRWACEWVDEYMRLGEGEGVVVQREFPCHWRAGEAGPARNRRMLKAVMPDVVVAFPGGAGTGSCVRAARKLGLLVLRVEP